MTRTLTLRGLADQPRQYTAAMPGHIKHTYYMVLSLADDLILMYSLSNLRIRRASPIHRVNNSFFYVHLPRTSARSWST